MSIWKINSAYPLLKAAGAFYYSWVEGKSNKLEVSMDMSTSFSLLEVILKKLTIEFKFFWVYNFSWTRSRFLASEARNTSKYYIYVSVRQRHKNKTSIF